MTSKAEQTALTYVTETFARKAKAATEVGNVADHVYFSMLAEWLLELAELREREEETIKELYG